MMEKVLASTVRIDFTTHDTTGALVAPSSAFAAADFRVYKDGSASEKATTNGITVTSPFDSIVGKHLIEIDTSNDTGDTGFWAAGSEYRVEINSAKTVASVVQSGVVLGRFRVVSADALRSLGAAAPTNWIDADSIASNAIAAAKIATNAITSAKIAANAITSSQIADGAITANKVAASALNGKGDWLLSGDYTAPDNSGIAAAVAAAVLARQILGNKHTVVESPPGTFTISVRNDADDATVRTIVYIPATGERTVS